jgi:competence protein ComEC
VSRARAANDLRLLLPVLAGWACIRIGLTHRPVVTLIAALVLAVLGVVAVCRDSMLLTTIGATLLICAALAGSAALHVYAAGLGPASGLAARQGTATVRATVTGDPKPVKSVILLPVRIDELDDADSGDPGAGDPSRAIGVRSRATVLALARTPGDVARWMDLVPSMRIGFVARFTPPDDPASGDTATLIADRAPRLLGGPDLVQSAAATLRADLRLAVAGLPAEPAGVLPALTLGDTRAVAADTTADLKTAGLSYLVVVSGENLVFLSAAALPLARRAGVRARALALLVAVLALGFTVLARPGPPMVRATVTALLASTAMVTGRRFHGLTATAGAALILLLIDPWLAPAYGFVLSVAATAGLLVSAPAWRDRLIVRHRVPSWIAVPAAFTAAAEVYCEPLLVTFTGSLPLYSIPANVLAVPAAAPATVLGVAAMAGYAVCPPAGKAAAWLAQWPARWICLVAHGVAHVPGAAVPWPRGLPGTVALLGGYVIGRKVILSLQRNTDSGGLDG